MRMPELPALTALRGLGAAPAQAWHGAGDAAVSGAFAQVMRNTHAEIAGIVENGWSAQDTPALGAEGLVRRAAALQAALLPTLGAMSAAAASGTAATPATAASEATQRDFLAGIAPWAREAGAALGVAPELVAAHAALESGWGRRPLRGADGGDTHNLFGIKAGGAWQGNSVQARTTEYEDGVAQDATEPFRAYADQASAFRDYARLLRDNPRYQPALNVGADAGAFAQGLARGGYATDPDYAAKLARMVRQVQARTTTPE